MVELAALAWAQLVAGDSIRVVGRVHDDQRSPLAGVEVLVNRRDLRATTDETGLFALWVSRADTTIAFRRIGYQPLLVTLDPLPGSSDTVRVRLRASKVYLPEVIVSASPSKPLRYAGTTKYDDVFLRRKVGLGTLITREMVDQRFGFSTAELVAGIPGVKYWNGPPRRLGFARCGEPNGITVFVDGVRLIGQTGNARGSGLAALTGRTKAAALTPFEYPEIEMLERVHPSDVEMIEVFRGASEIPGVFHWNGCAVIAIWTRWNK